MAIRYVWSGAAGGATGADWTNAYTTLSAAVVASGVGDTVYVAHDHAESLSSNISITSIGTAINPVRMLCVNRAGSVPPVSADRRTTATVTAVSPRNISFTGGLYVDGIIFTAGGSTITVNGGANYQVQRYDNCSLRLSAAGGGQVQLGDNATFGNLSELNNTTLSFGSTSQRVDVSNSLRWRNTPAALLGTIPSILFNNYFNSTFDIECIGVDLSAAGSGKTLCSNGASSWGNRCKFIDCKLDAAVTRAATPSGTGATKIDFIRCGASGVNYTVTRPHWGGVLTEETTIVRTGGATDGTTTLAWKIVTNTNCSFFAPVECPVIAIWNDTTGSGVTATVEGIAATLPKDDECWLEVEYLGSSSTPQGSFVSDAKVDLLTTAANQTSSSETWGGSTAAFKMAVTFTPQQKGWVYARIKIGKASSTLYIDPLVTLS